MRTRIDPVNIPEDLLPRVERFAELLEKKLDVFQSFEIEAVLSTAPKHLERSVLVRMGVRDDEGVMRWDQERCLTPDNLAGGDVPMGRLASHIVYQFIDHLSAIYGENLRRKLTEMQRREPVAVGA
jgi:hypothetical protein